MAARLALGFLASLMLTFAGAAAFGESIQPAPLKVIATVYAHAHHHTARCPERGRIAHTTFTAS
jgi:hypothetical protein